MSADKLIIRLLERQDIEFARCLHNDESVLMKLSDASHVSEFQQEKWFNSVSASLNNLRYTILEKATNEYVGVFRVDNIDMGNRSVCVGLDIAKSKRGQGYARDAYNYFLDYFFAQRGFHRVYLATLETNAVASSLYMKLGFEVEGRSREAIFRDGKFQDLVWMSILASDYLK